MTSSGLLEGPRPGLRRCGVGGSGAWVLRPAGRGLPRTCPGYRLHGSGHPQAPLYSSSPCDTARPPVLGPALPGFHVALPNAVAHVQGEVRPGESTIRPDHRPLLINDNKECRPVASLRNVTEPLASGVPPQPALIPALQGVPAQAHRPQRRPALWP